MPEKRTTAATQPWGLIAGLLTACVVTLVGVVCQLQPTTILFRATVASFGVGLVVGLAYSTLDVVDVIAVDAEISFLVILISLTYLGGVFIGRRKYQ